MDGENDFKEYKNPEFEESIEDRLDNIEQKLDDIESTVDNIERSMITWNGVFWTVIIIIVFFLWGDKLWEVIKVIGLFILAGILWLFEWLKEIFT